MILREVLEYAGDTTKVKVTINVFGMPFSAEHFPERFRRQEEMEELMDKEVERIEVTL